MNHCGMGQLTENTEVAQISVGDCKIVLFWLIASACNDGNMHFCFLHICQLFFHGITVAGPLYRNIFNSPSHIPTQYELTISLLDSDREPMINLQQRKGPGNYK